MAEPLFGCKPGDSVVSELHKPGVVHKVRFATTSSIRTMCWVWVTEDPRCRRVDEVPNCLECLSA